MLVDDPATSCLKPVYPVDASGLGNPEGIKEDLEKLLSDRINFSETFSFHRWYPDAPNPALSLTQFGSVGLPLSIREAQSIKAHIRLTNDEKRMRVDGEMHASLELDHSVTTFESPRWRNFVTRFSKDACIGLGIDFKRSRPRCELRKLVLFEPGSPVSLQGSGEEVLVNIMVILPSECAGGEVYASHNGVRKHHDCASGSELRTQVLAWYNNAACDFAPLLNGFRLALLYQLVPGSQPWPILRKRVDMVADLRRILHTWQVDEGEHAPGKIIYLLEQDYAPSREEDEESEENEIGASGERELHVGMLQDADARKVALLREVVEQSRFGLGLVSVHVRLVGDCAEDHEESDPEFESVDMEDVDVEGLYDLDGRLIAKTLQYKGESETIPSENFASYFLSNVEPYEVDDEYGYIVKKYYARTAVVIWPSWNNFSVRYGGPEGLANACDKLSATTNDSPDDHEKELAEYLLSEMKTDPPRVVAVLCQASFTWNDPTLWNKTLSKDVWPNGRRVMTDQQKFKAIERFGFDAVRTGIEFMLEHSPDDAARLAFLLELHTWAGTLGGENPSAGPIRSWLANKTQPLFEPMLNSPKPTDCSLIIRTAQVSGGLIVLESRLQRLIEQCDDYILAEFAQQLIKVFPGTPERKSLVSAFLTAAIAKAEFVPLPLSSGVQRPIRDPTVSIEVCRKAQCEHLISIIVDRVMGATYLAAPEAQGCAREIMLPLLEYLIQHRTQSAVVDAALEKLRTPTLELFVDSIASRPGELSEGHIATLVRAALAGNGFELFDSIMFRLEEMPLPAHVLRLMVEVLHAHRHLFGSPEAQDQHLSPVTHLFGLKYVGAAKFGASLTLPQFLDWTFKYQMTELIDAAAKRVLDPKKATLGEVRKKWVPMVHELRKVGVEHNALDTLAPAFQAIASAWLDKTMGTPPTSNATLTAALRALKWWECKCQYCKGAREFLIKNTDRTYRLEKIGVSMARHVETQVGANAKGLATTEPIRSTPQGVAVHKSEELFKLVWWRTKQTRGRDLLRNISTNQDELRRLLGPVYHRAMSTIYGGLPAPPPPLPLAPATAPSKAPVVAPSRAAGMSTHALAARNLPSASIHPYPPAASTSAYARNVAATLPPTNPYGAYGVPPTAVMTAPGRGVQVMPDGPVSKKAKTFHRYR